MASENVQANKLVELINLTISKFLPKYKDDGNLNYTEEGIITEVLTGNRCKVNINGSIKEISYSDNLNLTVNNVVIILRYNFDNNRRIVIAKKPSKW